VTAEMEQIEHAAQQKDVDDDVRGEVAFMRLLRTALTEFLESREWVQSIESSCWASGEDGGRSGVRLDVRVVHAHVADLEVIIVRGQN
jgi:hypothetical protein